MPLPILQAEDISIGFDARNAFKAAFRKPQEEEIFWALKNITIALHAGDAIGIIGKNGAGKSTLLRVLSGLLPPDTGRVEVSGRITAFLSLGAGFVNDLSGRENVRLRCLFLGILKVDLHRVVQEIIEYSELEEFIEKPLTNYSSGMRARLGFSISAHVNPDIMIMDEILAAGDLSFRLKAQKTMEQLMTQAKGIIIVSHSLPYVKKLCSHVIWIERGEIKMQGSASDVVEAYIESSSNA